jgi:uncharacterized membrane protein
MTNEELGVIIYFSIGVIISIISTVITTIGFIDRGWENVKSEEIYEDYVGEFLISIIFGPVILLMFITY